MTNEEFNEGFRKRTLQFALAIVALCDRLNFPEVRRLFPINFVKQAPRSVLISGPFVGGARKGKSLLKFVL